MPSLTGKKAEITDNAMALYKKRYLENETVNQMFHRVADGDPQGIALMEEGLFLPNSPALFNAGKNNGCTSSACFVFNIEDCMHRNDDGQINNNSIVETRAKAIAVAKAGGGVGYYGGFIRPRNSHIRSVHRKACGPVAVLRDNHAISHLITQGGKRELAQMFVLPVSHPDIREFIHCKDTDPQGLGSFNISTSWKEGEFGSDKYKDIFNEQVDSAWEHGCPGVFFEHHVNRNNPNPHLGLMLAPNPCVTGETLLLTKEGQYQIESLEGREVEVWNGREWSKTIPRQTGTKQKILKVKFSNGTELFCTKYHGFRLSDGKKVEAKDLVVGDCLEKWEDNPPIESVLEDACGSAYLAGFFCGDGFFNEERGQQMITFYGKKVKIGKILADQGLVNLIGRYDAEHDRQRASLLVAVPNKEEVPINASTSYKIEWLGGLLDSDGSIAYSDKSQRSYGYQVSSVNHQFLLDVSHMLRGMGIPCTVSVSHEAREKVMPGGEYECQTCYRLSISAWHSSRLISMGLEPLRLPNSENEPSRDASRFIKVVSVEDAGVADKVYCFDEPLRHRGVFNGILTSQCGETPNRNNEPCSLGSLNLWRFVCLKTREIMWDMLYEAAKRATYLMDSILDRNVFPHPDISAAAFLTRKLGLGVMGWADMLALLGIHYDTQEAVDLAEKVMETIDKAAIEASIELGKKKGPYPGYCAIRTKGVMRRNETNTSIAPTGSIGVLNNAFGGIEPYFALEWTRTTAEKMVLTEHVPVHRYLNGFVPKLANDIEYQWHIKHQAAFQRHTDLGVSKTVNLPKSATKKDVADCYELMHELECKGGTVFRDGCRDEQVLRATKTKSVYSNGVDVPLTATPTPTPPITSSPPEKVPQTLPGFIHRVRISGGPKFYVQVSFHKGKLYEVFITGKKAGSTVNGMMASWAITFSKGLQSGISMSKLCKPHIGTRFEPCGLTDNKDIPVCTSIIDYVCKWLLVMFDEPTIKLDTLILKAARNLEEVVQNVDSGLFCPECNMEATYIGGCLTCTCGWSKCG